MHQAERCRRAPRTTADTFTDRLTLPDAGRTLAVQPEPAICSETRLADAPTASRWAFRPPDPEPRSIVELIRAGTLDAELAATLWILVEARVPLLVAAAERGAGKTTLLRALLAFLPPDVRTVELAGSDETFEWLPQASELGWSGPRSATASVSPGGRPVRPDDTVLVIPELSDHLPSYTWGDQARLAIRAASIGYGLAATIHANSLDDVFADLRRPPVGVDDDELSRLGVVLILRRVSGGRRRVVAAHYVRPTARDGHGHVQRLGPAVLATWDPAADEFEHFGWGVAPELALRVGAHAGDFELDVERRRDVLVGLAAAGVTGIEEVARAIEHVRHTSHHSAPNATPH